MNIQKMKIVARGRQRQTGYSGRRVMAWKLLAAGRVVYGLCALCCRLASVGRALIQQIMQGNVCNNLGQRHNNNNRDNNVEYMYM